MLLIELENARNNYICATRYLTEAFNFRLCKLLYGLMIVLSFNLDEVFSQKDTSCPVDIFSFESKFPLCLHCS